MSARLIGAMLQSLLPAIAGDDSTRATSLTAPSLFTPVGLIAKPSPLEQIDPAEFVSAVVSNGRPELIGAMFERG
jgi:hypothetical protein